MSREADHIAHAHFARAWADRHNDRVHTFANGHRYDKAERRRSLRLLIQMMRREKGDS